MRELRRSRERRRLGPKWYPPPPRVGEDTREILAWLDLDDVRMADLKDRGVVNWPDESYAAAW